MADTRVKEYLQTHEKIKKIVKKKIDEGACVCVSVKDISNDLGIDPKAVKTHLDIMEIDEFGSYLDNNQKTFCSLEGIEKVRERIRKKIKEKELK